MSHLPERKEKICLNCKSVIYGRFCHVCGQENIQPRESLWHLITHFVYDITHFDGKFFSTLKYLLFKPGYLSYEYVRGRRSAYLNPIRMYIFTSAFFFILFFSFIVSNNEVIYNKAEQTTYTELLAQKKNIVSQIAVAKDSIKLVALTKELKKVNQSIRFMEQNGLFKFNFGDDEDTAVNTKKVINIKDWPATLKSYDSIQASLPEPKKDGWFESLFKRKIIGINEKYEGRQKLFGEKVKDKFIHSIPQMMFISLPIVALILQLLYIRRRKTFFYVSHAIFAIQVYIAIYILTLIAYAFNGIGNASEWNIFYWLQGITIFLMFFYVYKAMRNFYQQRRAKTVLKYIILMFSFFTLISILMVIYALTSAFTI